MPFLPNIVNQVLMKMCSWMYQSPPDQRPLKLLLLTCMKVNTENSLVSSRWYIHITCINLTHIQKNDVSFPCLAKLHLAEKQTSGAMTIELSLASGIEAVEIGVVDVVDIRKVLYLV